MKRQVVQFGEKRDMKRQDRAERRLCRTVCAASVLCAVLFLTACAGESPAAGQSGQDASTKQIGQDEDWLAQRIKRDGRTKHDPVSYTHLTLPTIYSV